jgi:putative hydrolase of the HAD superfamily
VTEPFSIPLGVRAIFLDVVGTLLHPAPSVAAAYAAAGKRFASRLDAATIAGRFRAAFARQEERDYAAGLRTDEAREIARWQAIVAAVLDDVTDPTACFHYLYAYFARPDAWACDPAAGPVLRALAGRGYRLGIASNFDKRLRNLVAALPDLTPIQDIVISSEVGWRKPAAAFFEHMCRQTDLDPGQILLLGDDQVNDYQGARAVGMHAVLLDPHRPEPIPEEARISRLDDLLLTEFGPGGTGGKDAPSSSGPCRP